MPDKKSTPFHISCSILFSFQEADLPKLWQIDHGHCTGSNICHGTEFNMHHGTYSVNHTGTTGQTELGSDLYFEPVVQFT